MLVVSSNKAGPFLPPCSAQSFPGSRLWLYKSAQLVVGLQTLMRTSVMLPDPALPKMSQGRRLMGLKGQTLLPQVSQYETRSVQTDLSQNRIVNKYGNTEQTQQTPAADAGSQMSAYYQASLQLRLKQPPLCTTGEGAELKETGNYTILFPSQPVHCASGGSALTHERRL